MKNRFPQFLAVPRIDYRRASRRTASLQNEQFSSYPDFIQQFNAAVISLTVDSALFHKFGRGCS